MVIWSIFKLQTRRIVVSIALISAAICSANSLALSPEFEADRLMLLAQEQVSSEQFSQADITLRQIQELKVTPPSEYYYLRGLVLSHGDSTQEAIDSLRVYVESSGKEAEHYSSSLRLISQLKAKLPAMTMDTSEQTEASIQWTGKSQEKSDYVEQIRYLYQSGSDKRALIEHINNMLTTYRLANAGDGRFTLGSDKPGSLFTKQQGAKSMASQMTVYGIDPYVQYRCISRANGCQFLHPITKQPWLTIKNDEQAARELSKAIAELIKLLQTNA